MRAMPAAVAPVLRKSRRETGLVSSSTLASIRMEVIYGADVDDAMTDSRPILTGASSPRGISVTLTRFPGFIRAKSALIFCFGFAP